MNHGRGQLRVPLLTAAIDDETTSQPVNVTGYNDVAIFVAGNGTIASGVITIEEADYPTRGQAYGGTWSTITTVNASDVTGDAMKAVHLSVAAYSWIRARISTVIGGGGSVTVSLRAS